MRILNNGNVGIGTTAPSAPLHVAIAGATSGVDYEVGRMDTTGSGSPYFTLGASATGGGYVLYEKNNAVIRFGTHQNTGYFARFSTSGAMIANNANSDLGGSFDGALLVRPMAAGTKGLTVRGFTGQTADLFQWQNSAGTVLGVINSSGNVGIGTTGPNDKLEVAGGIRVDDYIRARDSGGLALKTDEGTTRLFVKDNGNVGIGTTRPRAKLEVAGRVKITGGSPGAGKVLTSDASGLASWSSSLEACRVCAGGCGSSWPNERGSFGANCDYMRYSAYINNCSGAYTGNLCGIAIVLCCK